MERVIETGKYKNQRLSQCPESYIKWAASHLECYSESNRWISRDAKKLLEKKEETMFEIKEEEGRKGIEYACYQNGKQCTTALGKPVAFKSRKAAENYLEKQAAIRQQESQISDEERAAMRKDREEREAAEKAARDAAFDERLRKEREKKEARRQRAITNSTLRSKGYKWINVGFKSEEDADAFDPNLPIGTDWVLLDPEGKAVSVQEAMGRIG